MTEPMRGFYRDPQPGEKLPDDYVSIPMYLTTAQIAAFGRLAVAERAKDVTANAGVRQ